MRNLKLLESKCADIGCAPHCVAVNCDTGELYVATSDLQLLAVEPSTGQVTASVHLKDAVGEDIVADADTRFEAIQYLPDDQALCAVTNKGELLVWSLLSYQLESVGGTESGFTGMSWSPDMELVIMTTGAGTMIMMTREFEPITETSLCPKQFGEAEFVQVGWGKKETQFHGSAGKSAAQIKPEEVKPVQLWDDRKPRVTWRGDGQFFAVSVVHPDTGARKVFVWTRDCVHHSTSENVDGIEQALAWKPSGSLIITSQRRPNKHDIAFFEKNGLRHGEFTLPFDPDQVKVNEVYWNMDSTVLAVWCEDLSNENNKKSYVQLWTTGNYYWYLKQSLHFDGPEESICGIVWDPEQAYRLHLLCKNGKYFQYTWSWATSHSDGRDSQDQALVAVIDGAKVLMTPMRRMVVPPPMSSYQLDLPSAVNHIAFCPSPHSNDMAVVLVDGQVAIYKFIDGESEKGLRLDGAGGTGFNRCCQVPIQTGLYSLSDLPPDTNQPLGLSHFTWLSDDVIIFTSVSMATQPHSILHRANICPNKISVVKSTPLEGCVFGITFDNQSKTAGIQLTDGTILRYSLDDEVVLPWELDSGEEMRFPVPCIQMGICQIGGEVAIVGLTERYRLYVNNVEVATNCTSFSIHDEFLLLTTLTHTCRCISRHTKVKDLPSLSDGKAHPFDESVRRVERGSRIVISVPDDTRLILQMPRGNLETVHPRALILSAVRKHLDKLQYKEAFVIMRKHRINMNLIYDHCPKSFLDHVQMFVKQVETVSHINLFLTDLLEEDVTGTMYTAAYERNKQGTSSQVQGTDPGPTKVDVICDAVRQTLINLDENKYLLSILTTYVRKSKPELEQALQLVKKLRDCENDMPHISAEEALKYLLFLVDVNELYDIALGTYDFDLVLMVAEKSQKDPKEYIPFLNQLRKMETNYQHFTIDKYLKRYRKALENIAKCGLDRFEECMALINEQNLHPAALQMYPPTSSQYKEIASCYGDLLSEKRRHEEAAIMYVKGENWEYALQSYFSAADWQQVFCMAALLQHSSEKEAELARKMAEELKSRSRYGEAAIVLEQYAKDTEEAIVTLIEGGLWDESLRLMYRYKRTDFIETNLKTQLLESFDNHMCNLDQHKENFNKYRSRLTVVRQEKEKARLELLEAGEMGNVQDSDLFSDTSSATGVSVQSSQYSASTSSSVYSKMSGRSQKNRRKAEHKKWRLKEGSEFEDFALIAALAKIVTYTDTLREEIRSLLRTLQRFHFDTQATELQRKFDNLLQLIDKSIPQIWLDEEVDSSPKPVLGPDSTANTIALAMQQGKGAETEEREGKLDPVIRFAPVLRKDCKWKVYSLES